MRLCTTATLVTPVPVVDAATPLLACRVLRSLRALRPLKIAAQYEGMKIVVNALIRAVPAMGNAFVVCFLFFVMFGIVATNLLAVSSLG